MVISNAAWSPGPHLTLPDAAYLAQWLTGVMIPARSHRAGPGDPAPWGPHLSPCLGVPL